MRWKSSFLSCRGPWVEFSLVPIMLGFSLAERGADAYVEALAEALAALIDDRTLLVASTDLSHLDNYADVVATDRELVERVDAFDVDGLTEALRAGRVNACGDAGLATVFARRSKTGRDRGAGPEVRGFGRRDRR